MNSAAQNGAGDFVRYHRSGGRSFLFDINRTTAPSFEILGFDQDRFGASLVFNAAAQQYVSLYDGDNSAGRGYLVSAVVNFDDLSLNEGETGCIMAKSDNGGGVYIWIKNNGSGTISGSGSGEVVRNNSPILLGADPQGAAARCFYFSGKIQSAIVLDWGSRGSEYR